jgi:hypothetical protein
MNYLEALTRVFSNKPSLWVFALATAVLGIVLGVTSNIIVPSALDLNPVAEHAGIGVTAVIVLLMGLNTTVLFHNVTMKAAGGGGMAVLGSFGALFTTACPVCQPIWLVWLGLGSATAFLAEIGLYVGLFSIGLLLVSLHYSLKSATGTCEVKTDGKNH